jgi:TRAP-type C4-dicarboxylate transport system permease small subunit
MSERTNRFLTRLTCLLGFLFGAVMTWKGFNMAWAALKYEERMSTPLGTPMFIPYGMIPVGFGLMSLLYLVYLIIGQEAPAEKAQSEV